MSVLCECGCGDLAPIATRTRNELGWIKGQPKRFVNGHNRNRRKHDPGYVVNETTGCWEWTGQLRTAGYGTLYVRGEGFVQAHRWMYEQHVGPIPDGMQLDHLCRNRRCVNPAHLEPVTNRENCLRGVSPAAQHAKVTHCPAGHPYEGDNIYVCPRGTRRCRACARQAARERYARSRTA
jgi:hypothetical protein